jgi:hypothetical protein
MGRYMPKGRVLKKHQLYDLRFVKTSFILAITPGFLGMFFTHLFLGTSMGAGFFFTSLLFCLLSTIIIKFNLKYYLAVPEYILKMKKIFVFMFLFGALGAYSTTPVANSAEGVASILLLLVYFISIWQLTRSESALSIKESVVKGI